MSASPVPPSHTILIRADEDLVAVHLDGTLIAWHPTREAAVVEAMALAFSIEGEEELVVIEDWTLFGGGNDIQVAAVLPTSLDGPFVVSVEGIGYDQCAGYLDALSAVFTGAVAFRDECDARLLIVEDHSRRTITWSEVRA